MNYFNISLFILCSSSAFAEPQIAPPKPSASERFISSAYSYLESNPLFAALQTPFYASDESALKEKVKTYWHAKLDYARLTNSFKQRAFALISPALAPLSILLTRNYGWKVQMLCAFAFPAAFNGMVNLGIHAWDSMVENPEDGVTQIFENTFHSQSIVDKLQAKVDEAVEEAFRG